ncbi:MAG: ABC transporter substrate-binding protein, partial [Bacteroidota bacterium]
GRNFLIKTATGGGIPVLAPSADWVREGAHIMMHSDGSGVRLVVNKRAADAASLSIPEQYSAQTEFLAAN